MSEHTTHYCRIGTYGFPCQTDGEQMTREAAEETVALHEQYRQEHPDKLVETPYGCCKLTRVYLSNPGSESGVIYWQLEERAS